MNYTKLNRVTKDIGLFGVKGSFKTTVAVLIAYLENTYYNTEIFSNIKDLKFPHHYIKSIEELRDIGGSNRKLFVGDDFERWFYSRNWKTNIELNQILLDWGKIYMSLVYDAKREFAIDKGLREATSEFWYNKPFLYIKSNTGDINKDHINNNILKKYADFIKIKIKRFNAELEPINSITIGNLPTIFKLFSTKEIINEIIK